MMLIEREDLSQEQISMLVFVTKQRVRSVHTEAVDRLVDLGLITRKDGFLRATHSAWSLLLCGRTVLATADF